MSSSNLVEVVLIEESVYGEAPATGDFDTARFTSESLSGTPETTESQLIRADRLSSGQVVTGLTVGGDLQLEIAKSAEMDAYFKSAMQSEWVASVAVTTDLTVDTTAKTLVRSSGDWTSQVRVGDMLILTGFTEASNNETQVMVSTINSVTEISYVGPETLVDEVGAGNTFQVADYLEIGIDKKSFTMQKRFLDLTDKAIIYKGQVVSDIDLTAAYGDIVKGSVTFSGNHYEPVEDSADFITEGRTVLPAATSQPLNGSVDMPFVASSTLGTLDAANFCIQSVNMKLGNNLNPQNCIGVPAPTDYTLGTAQIEVALESYLADSNWNLLAKKLTQDPFSLGYQIKNADGWYAFYMPAIQVSFDDPASGGQNQDVIMSMTGQAKVGANGESSLRIYRS